MSARFGKKKAKRDLERDIKQEILFFGLLIIGILFIRLLFILLQ